MKYSLSQRNRHPIHHKFTSTRKFMHVLRCDRNFRYADMPIRNEDDGKIETLEQRPIHGNSAFQCIAIILFIGRSFQAAPCMYCELFVNRSGLESSK